MCDQAARSLRLTRVTVGKITLRPIELRAVAVPGHGNIGQMPVHRARGHDKGPVHRRPLVLVDRRRIAVVDGLIIAHRNADAVTLAVQRRDDAAVLDALDRAKHPVLHPEVAVVLKEHDPVARRELRCPSLVWNTRALLAPSSPGTLARASSPRSCSSARIASLIARTSARRCAIATRLPSGRASRSAR